MDEKGTEATAYIAIGRNQIEVEQARSKVLDSIPDLCKGEPLVRKSFSVLILWSFAKEVEEAYKRSVAVALSIGIQTKTSLEVIISTHELPMGRNTRSRTRDSTL